MTTFKQKLQQEELLAPTRQQLFVVYISRFGVIPKKHQPGKWCLILDLSFPKGKSVNDGIDKDVCSLRYITTDDAAHHIMTLGRGSFLAKIDVKSAFRLLPIHPTDRHLLGMQWNGNLFIDTCLPFGLRSAPKLFNVLADLLSWILQQQGAYPFLNYLDDFLIISPPNSPACQHHLTTVKHICNLLGVPLAEDKEEGPATSLTFLGIILDTVLKQARLPLEKLERLQSQWITKYNATKRQILSLVG